MSSSAAVAFFLQERRRVSMVRRSKTVGMKFHFNQKQKELTLELVDGTVSDYHLAKNQKHQDSHGQPVKRDCARRRRRQEKRPLSKFVLYFCNSESFTEIMTIFFKHGRKISRTETSQPSYQNAVEIYLTSVRKKFNCRVSPYKEYKERLRLSPCDLI